MKIEQGKLIRVNSRSSTPGSSKIKHDDEVVKRFFEQVLKSFGHIR